jgi:hypothetical protein
MVVAMADGGTMISLSDAERKALERLMPARESSDSSFRGRGPVFSFVCAAALPTPRAHTADHKSELVVVGITQPAGTQFPGAGASRTHPFFLTGVAQTHATRNLKNEGGRGKPRSGGLRTDRSSCSART